MTDKQPTQPAAGAEEPQHIIFEGRDCVVMAPEDYDSLRSLLSAERAQIAQAKDHVSSVDEENHHLKQRASRLQAELDKLRSGDSVVVPREKLQDLIYRAQRIREDKAVVHIEAAFIERCVKALLHPAAGGEG